MPRNKTNPTERAAKVLIVDDHPVVREGLAIHLSRHPDLEVCGEAADVPDALKLIAATDPDVAVVDISLKTGNGIDLIKRIKARNDKVRILVWSMHSDTLYAERALRAGALGYVNKEAATSEIVDAIRRVRDGKVYLSESVSNDVLSRAVGLNKAQKSPVATLSDRELETFELLGQGLDGHKICQKMRISYKTVETYRARIKEKLNLHSGTELIQRAVQWMMEKE